MRIPHTINWKHSINRGAHANVWSPRVNDVLQYSTNVDWIPRQLGFKEFLYNVAYLNVFILIKSLFDRAWSVSTQRVSTLRWRSLSAVVNIKEFKIAELIFLIHVNLILSSIRIIFEKLDNSWIYFNSKFNRAITQSFHFFVSIYYTVLLRLLSTCFLFTPFFVSLLSTKKYQKIISKYDYFLNWYTRDAILSWDIGFPLLKLLTLKLNDL